MSNSTAVPQYDVIVIGSGAAGALVAYALAKKAVKVLLLEAGDAAPDERYRESLVRQYEKSSSKAQVAPYVGFVAPQPNSSDTPQPANKQAGRDYYVEENGPRSKLFLSFYQRMVGGAMWHWQGIAIRMIPNDFKMKTKYGIGRDWPIAYSDLEPWYVQAEHEMGVAGNTVEAQNMHGAFRSKGFPMPEIPPSYGDLLFRKALSKASIRGVPIQITSTPQARNSVSGYDGRPACEGYSSCVPLCPTRAKYEALFHVEKALRWGAELRARSIVTRLEVNPVSGEVTRVAYRRWDSANEEVVSARIVVLAANGIESPKLLLLSNQQQAAGVANSSGLVGRFLMDHPLKVSYALSREPVFPFRGPPSTSGIESFRDGTFRSDRAAFRTSIRNDGWSFANGSPRGKDLTAAGEANENTMLGLNEGTLLEFVRTDGYIGKQLKERVTHDLARQILVYSAAEMLPDPENRVSVDLKQVDSFGIPRPMIRFSIDDYARKGLSWASELHKLMFLAMGARAQDIRLDLTDDPTGQDFGSGHIMGTTVMGENSANSVVDPECRAHDAKNLFVVGSSVFPTGSAANPTLTIAALALRAAESIRKQLSS